MMKTEAASSAGHGSVHRCHAQGTCCGCGPKHYEYEVWQDGVLQAGGSTTDYASAKSEASHYAAMYTPDGPVEVRIYEKRLLSAVQQPAEQRSQPKHSPYNASGSLSEYGVFPECDAQQPADDEVVFIDGVGAGRSSIKSCHDGVQWIRVGDRVYWPLSDSDAKRLQSACCGNGSFDGPATPASEGRTAMTDRYENIRRVLAECRDIAMEWTMRGRIPECGKFGEIAQDLDAVCSELEITDPERAQQPAVHPAITHCDNCGCDWLDNGLNPVGCPYCKQSAEIEALRTEVERLKSMTAVTMGVGSGDGNLFVHGDYDSIKAAQALVFRAERLAEVLSKILENEASDLKAAEEFGGYVLDDELREEARAALAKGEQK